MATSTPTQREIVEFEPNVPVEVALKYAGAGKIVSGRFGDRVMYTLTDNRIMFLDLGVAQKINELEVNVRETFFVHKAVRKGERVEWQVWLSPETEKARAAAELAQVPLDQQLKHSLALAGESERDRQLTTGLAQVSASFGPQPNGGGFKVPKLDPAPAVSNPHAAPKPAVRASASSQLVDEANALVDAYAQILERTLTTYQGRIKPEECRSLLLSAYIQRGKAAGHVA